jgi:hypothetical protein
VGDGAGVPIHFALGGPLQLGLALGPPRTQVRCRLHKCGRDLLAARELRLPRAPVFLLGSFAHTERETVSE